MHRNQLVEAAADAVSARLAIDAAARRRAAATVSAQHLMDLARATERAERDAAWSALAASVRLLMADQVAIGDIAELCGMSADSVRGLSVGDLSVRDRTDDDRAPVPTPQGERRSCAPSTRVTPHGQRTRMTSCRVRAGSAARRTDRRGPCRAE